MRLLIERSIPLPFVTELLRGLYVEVAVKEFPVEGKRQTDSRVNLLTGVHRKDVKRLRAQRHPGFDTPRGVSLGAQLITRWTTEREYVDARGAALPLPRLGGDREGPSFEGLVRSVNTDIRPRVVLDEWLRLGIVHIDDEDRVCLNVQAFLPAEGSEEMAYFFGRNVHDHLAAAAHNVLGRPSPFLERSVYYNNLDQSSVEKLNALAKERGMEVLRELNTLARKLQRKDSGTTGATRRMNFGVYFFSEDDSASTDEDPDDER